MSRPRLTNELIAALRRVLPADAGPYGLHEPMLGDLDWQRVKACLESGWVSSAGPAIADFEAALAETTGVPHAIATVNGTAALHLALLTAGVAPGDEVIVPALTFVATVNAVSYCGATPHFADAGRGDLGLDVEKLSAHLSRVASRREGGLYNETTGRRIAAVVCVHALGHPAALDPLADLCREWRLPLVEDAAEALGTLYKGRHVGARGLLATLSFNGNKIVTTGGGGAVLTSDESLANHVRHLATTAKQPHPWRYDHDELGYNYRLPNINAALGCAQIERLETFVADKRELADRYARSLAGVDGLRVFEEPPHARSNYWLNAIMLDKPDAALRDDILAALHAEGIRARPLWTPAHRLPMYGDAPRDDLSVTEDLEARLICLPSSASLV